MRTLDGSVKIAFPFRDVALAALIVVEHRKIGGGMILSCSEIHIVVARAASGAAGSGVIRVRQARARFAAVTITSAASVIETSEKLFMRQTPIFIVL